MGKLPPEKWDKTTNPLQATMPSVRIRREVKVELFDLMTKTESYSDVIQRVIDFYKSKHK